MFDERRRGPSPEEEYAELEKEKKKVEVILKVDLIHLKNTANKPESETTLRREDVERDVEHRRSLLQEIDEKMERLRHRISHGTLPIPATGEQAASESLPLPSQQKPQYTEKEIAIAKRELEDFIKNYHEEEYGDKEEDDEVSP